VHIATLNCLLPRADIPRAMKPPANLLNREEGIDLRLPRKPQGLMFLWRNAANPVSGANRFRCWVDLDENLVLYVGVRLATDVDRD